MRNINQWGQDVVPNIAVLAMDVTSDKSVQTAVESIVMEAGRIDVVINNAGVLSAGTVELVNLNDAKVCVLHLLRSLKSIVTCLYVSVSRMCLM
jgi:NADP-dependent 3-hydroxy acid dehydrogenase YdfG